MHKESDRQHPTGKHEKQVVNLFLIREHCNRFGVPLLSGATAQKQEACVCVGGGGGFASIFVSSKRQ